VQAEVAHVTEQMSLRILRSRPPDMHSQAIEGDRAEMRTPTLDRQAAKQHEASPMQQFVCYTSQTWRERRQWKVCGGEFIQRARIALDTGEPRLRSRSEFVDLRRQ